MKNFWMKADKKNIDDFITLLNEHTLDPTMLNYGKFVRKNKRMHYSPKFAGVFDPFTITTSFLDLSWSFEGAITPEIYLKAKKAVTQHFKTERFQKAFRESFNCYQLELTYYTKEIMAFGDWYGEIKSKMYFPLNRGFSSEFRNEWKNLQDKGNSLKNINGFEVKIKFCKVHFTQQETEELRSLESLFVKKQVHINTLIYQCRDIDKKENMKQFTFKSSGRIIWLDFSSQWGLFYFAESPTITKPTML